MTELWIVGLVMVTCFTGPVAAFAMLWTRKRRAHTRRRSPLREKLLRGPGHTLREELDELQTDVMGDLFALMVMPLMALTLLFAFAALRGGIDKVMHLAWLTAIAAVGYVAFSIRKLLKLAEKADRLKAGYDAECAVGEQLNHLMRQSAQVFHDVPGDGFNIDHVVVSPRGVYAVETKGYTKPNRQRGTKDAKVTFDGTKLTFPTFTTAEPIDQALRQAKWLSEWLGRAAGERVEVQPVLALPGWFVERTGRHVVRVYSGKALPSLLATPVGTGLAAKDVERIAYQVEQRCRTVVLRYGEAPAAQGRG